MQDLRLVGVSEDSVHLILAAGDGTRFRVPLDSSLKAAVRHERPRQLGDDRHTTLSPREVQALIRAGASAAEVAELAGWSMEKVAKYEGPIVAEREYVAGLATAVRLSSFDGGAPTLGTRVAQRLVARGVDPDSASWDAWRSVGQPWMLVLTFGAGGRLREARWQFDVPSRTVTAADDEARWLSEDEAPSTPEPFVPVRTPAARPEPVVVDTPTGAADVRPPKTSAPGPAAQPRVATPAATNEHPPEPASAWFDAPQVYDLDTAGSESARRHSDEDEDAGMVDAMRERVRRRRSTRRPAAPKTRTPAAEVELPLEPAPAPTPVPAAAAPAPAASADPEPATDAPVREAAAPEPAAATQPELVAEAAVAEPSAPVAPAAPPEPVEPAAELPDSVPAAPIAEPGVAPDEPTVPLPDPFTAPDDEPAPAAPAARDEQPDSLSQDEIRSVDQPQTDPEALERDSDAPAPAPASSAPEAVAIPEPAASAPAPVATDDGEGQTAPETQPAPKPAAPKPAPPKKRSGRTSVPSWDDVMFGSRRD